MINCWIFDRNKDCVIHYLHKECTDCPCLDCITKMVCNGNCTIRLSVVRSLIENYLEKGRYES